MSSAGGRLLRTSGILLSEQQCLRRVRENRSVVHQRMERAQGKKQQTLVSPDELQETAGRSDTGYQQISRKGSATDSVVEEDDGKLIPGIPGDVAINHILVKMDWADLMALSSVSPAWHRVIHGREVYEARLRQSCTQSFLAVVHKASLYVQAAEPSQDFRDFGDFVSRFYEDNDRVPTCFHLAISLYNPSANSWHSLPPIPQVNCGIPHMSACAFVSGRLYVLGGEGRRNTRYTPRKSVYVMDLAVGHRGEWKQCASMRRGRSDFACSVIEGKIYVAGGWSHLDHVWIEAEMYDPEKDSWHCIESMQTPRLNYSVGTIDEELYVIGGSVFHSLAEGDNNDKTDDEHAEWADVYNPRNNQWRRMDRIGSNHKSQTWVVIDNKLFSFRSDHIDVYEKCSETWRAVMSNSWEVLESTGAIVCSACAITQVKDEVYAFVRWLKGWPYELSLLYSKDFANAKGFDTGIKKPMSPVWNIVKCPYEFKRDFFYLVPVQL